MAVPAERVAELLLGAGYHRLPLPLHVADLAFNVADAFVGAVHSADLVIVGDMAVEGERQVIQQIGGIARALDVVRSKRPLTTVIVGPRPVGQALDTLAQVSRVLAVEEATDPNELRDRLAILLPLELPSTLAADRDLGAHEELVLPDSPAAREFYEASEHGEDAVRNSFHQKLNTILDPEDEVIAEVDA